jgi:hypothetical protein
MRLDQFNSPIVHQSSNLERSGDVKEHVTHCTVLAVSDRQPSRQSGKLFGGRVSEGKSRRCRPAIRHVLDVRLARQGLNFARNWAARFFGHLSNLDNEVGVEIPAFDRITDDASPTAATVKRRVNMATYPEFRLDISRYNWEDVGCVERGRPPRKFGVVIRIGNISEWRMMCHNDSRTLVVRDQLV